MALSKEWTEWHLTPGGWVPGSHREDCVGVTQVPDPPGSVAVYSYREDLSSMYSSMDRSVTCQRKMAPQSVIDGLLAQHGSCPERL